MPESSQPPVTRAEMIETLAAGCKPPSAWRIGTEHEKFGFRLSDHGPLPYEGDGPSIRAMLEGMQRFGWTCVCEDGRPIALKRDDASITLEPGGQFELSGGPLECLNQTCSEVNRHLREVRAVADEIGAGFLGVGFSPLWSLDETPRMPKARYGIMRAYMPKVGRLGLQMMFRSATVQTNLDFASEADMVRKFRVSLALQPVATALFANSPFADGKPHGWLSYRAYAWADTDPARTGTLPFVFESGMGFERYVDYLLDVPMYFVNREGRYIDAAGQSFRAFMEGKLPALPGERPTLADFENHMSTAFPEVRLKRFLEMRGADSGPWHRLCALPALWVGLLYDDAALDAAWDLVRDWAPEEREALRLTAPALGLRTPFRDTRMLDLAREVLAIARAGLRRRARASECGEDESRFLDVLDEIVDRGTTPAEELLRQWREDWDGDLDRIFDALAY